MSVHRARSVIAPLAGVGLALLGQRLLETQVYVLDGALLLGAAVALFVWGAWGTRSATQSPPVSSGGVGLAPSLRWGLGATAVVLATIAFLKLGGNRFTVVGTLAWVTSCLCFVVASWEWAPGLAERWRARARGVLSGEWRLRISGVGVALLLIFLLALFFRVYKLDAIPRELGSDHAEKLLDVQDVLDGMRPIFFPRNTGREAMQFYLAAAIIHLFSVPVSFLALKIGTVIIGVLAAPAVFLLLREMFGGRLALIGTFLLAASQWHVGITRMGLRYPFPSLFGALAIYFLVRAVKHQHRNDYLMAGLVAGIGLHTYIPCRAVPILIGLVLVLDPLLNRQTRGVGWRRYAVNAALCFAVMLSVFLPLGRFMKDDPQGFWSRVTGRVTSSEQPIRGNPIVVLLGNWRNALLAFNFRGDVVPVSTIPGVPFLDWVSGGLFAIGFVWNIARGIRDRDRFALYALLGLLSMLLPSVLSLAYPGENPSVVRMGGAIPFVYGMAALPVDELLLRFGRMRFRALGSALTLLVLVPLAVGLVCENYRRYFVRYDQQYRSWSPNTSEMGAAVRGFTQCCGPISNAFHVAWPYWADTRNIGINAGDIRWNNALHNADQVRQTASVAGAKMYILHPDDKADVALLHQMFPCGELLVHGSATSGHEFLIFQTPATCAPAPPAAQSKPPG